VTARSAELAEACTASQRDVRDELDGGWRPRNHRKSSQPRFKAIELLASKKMSAVATSPQRIQHCDGDIDFFAVDHSTVDPVAGFSTDTRGQIRMEFLKWLAFSSRNWASAGRHWGKHPNGDLEQSA